MQTTRQAGKKNQIIPYEREEKEGVSGRRVRSTRRNKLAHLENVVDDEVARHDDNEQAHVDPAEEGKLLREVLLLEVRDETNEAWEMDADATAISNGNAARRA